ncbi:MCE family protein [Nocardia jinanensis]|uniref:Mammalian cell entry protein n=1 Tax=Nocardia jinanensis TaxID=382504 RepID=A0A917RLU8_9NOCA|nr:MCE family protein [Nocardia jinanensis]GGL13174.1 mammalian cell entry protein [Nocardia jinanensis]
MTIPRKLGRPHRAPAAICCVAALLLLSGCGQWRGANSLPLPGAAGHGAGSYRVQIQMPDVSTIQENSRVRVADVNIGSITRIERQGWHALVTVTIDRDVVLPANVTAAIGQTSLLGSQHIELAPPIGVPAAGQLHDGDVIPLDRADQYPTTEQTLATLSMVLNGGGLGRLQQINKELNAALTGHEAEVRSLLDQLNTFTDQLQQQSGDIVAAIAGLNNLADTVNRQNDVLTNALRAIPPALQVLNEQRDNLVAATTAVGDFAATADDIVTTSRDDIIANLRNLQPTLTGLADAGQDLTRSLGFYTTFPWPEINLPKWVRGDYANLTAIIDLTLGRIDNSMMQGTPWEGQLTALETALGRTDSRQPGLGTPNPLTGPLAGGR